jgi:hypothetical protein
LTANVSEVNTGEIVEVVAFAAQAVEFVQEYLCCFLLAVDADADVCWPDSVSVSFCRPPPAAAVPRLLLKLLELVIMTTTTTTTMTMLVMMLVMMMMMKAAVAAASSISSP